MPQVLKTPPDIYDDFVVWSVYDSHSSIFGPLAQLVEHRTFNPMVERSNRSRPTMYTIENAQFLLGIFFLCLNWGFIELCSAHRLRCSTLR